MFLFVQILYSTVALPFIHSFYPSTQCIDCRRSTECLDEAAETLLTAFFLCFVPSTDLHPAWAVQQELAPPLFCCSALTACQSMHLSHAIACQGWFLRAILAASSTQGDT